MCVKKVIGKLKRKNLVIEGIYLILEGNFFFLKIGDCRCVKLYGKWRVYLVYYGFYM